MRWHYLETESGFTLVELIITATYVAAVSAAIVGIFITVNTLTKHARNLEIATSLAQQKIETDRDAGYSAIPASEIFTSSLPANFGSPKSAVATFTDLSPVQPGLKKLDVSITWKDNGGPKHVQISTLVAQVGIDR